MPFKPGYRTSEFWFTLVSFIFSALFLLGIIKENDTKEELISIVSHAVESIILIGGQVIIFTRYIRSRDRQKKEYNQEKQKELEDYIGVGKSYNTININSATLGELIQLPHIGTVIAGKIIDYRNNKGHFNDIAEITNVNGVGETVFQDIKQFITI
jgi:competence ComEA-like helix-hairpin-helix protein